MKLESSAFENGKVIPSKYGYKTENLSPPLQISEIPEGTKSLVLIMDDPDAMGAVGKVWVHWVLWNISSDTKEIFENSIPNNSVEGKTDFDEIGYGGPAPPNGRHTYIFKAYALDVKLSLKEGYSKQDLEDAMKGHIIAKTKLTGTFAP